MNDGGTDMTPRIVSDPGPPLTASAKAKAVPPPGVTARVSSKDFIAQ